ncbi:MAG TPA: hypothetical protein VGG11_18515 [Xanthobacteraceae bacterium]|jgi:hypothetical protein
MTAPRSFLDALVSAQRAPELVGADDIFGFLIGSWDIEAVLHDRDGRMQRSKGEVHASWVLEGRAIQDLFIFPRRADRASGGSVQDDRYATTIRTFDRMQEAWRVDFINPAAPETSAQLMARRSGQGIEMEGALADGTRIQWSYQSITPTSFHYSAKKRVDDRSWKLYLELFGKRADS